MRLAEVLQLEFEDPELLKTALTHRSFAFEGEGVIHNERLEFLGDAVLDLIVAEFIYKEYPHFPEGEMAKIRSAVVNMATLAEAADEIGLGEELFLGKGEELSGGRQKASLLADGFEAVVGAVYLDRGMPACRSFVERLLMPRIRDSAERGLVHDFKTSLQELSVQQQGTPPEYRTTSSGPDHAKHFEAEAFVVGRLVGSGKGRSKKEAEQQAAKNALAELERTKVDHA